MSRITTDEALVVRRLALLIAGITALVLAGTVGYAAIEGTSPAYGFLWTLDVITTVGGNPEPGDTAGRVLQAGLEILGIGTLFYALATVAEFFVSGQLSGLLARRRTQAMIDALQNHYIVCGYGRVGRQAARDLVAESARYVVVDITDQAREAAVQDEVLFIEGSGSDDDVLRVAGIDRARGVLACVDSDAENIFVTLTARQLRSDILIVARASAEDSEQKLMRAGADRVISPYKSSGSEMARIALHPQISGAFEHGDVRIEEIVVTPSCAGAGRTVAEVRGGALIVALRRGGDGVIEPQPTAQRRIEPGDRLYALGDRDALDRLERFFEPAEAGAPR